MDKKPLKIRTLTDGRDMKTDELLVEDRLVGCSCCDGTGKVADDRQDITDETPDLSFEIQKRDDGVFTTLTTYYIEGIKVENASIEHTLKDVKDSFTRQISYVCFDIIEENSDDKNIQWILIELIIEGRSYKLHRRINKRNGDVNISTHYKQEEFIDEQFKILNNSTFDKLYRQSK